MLAKIWKKLLFAICIIACLFNVMNKLVKQTSLDKQLKSVLQNSGYYEKVQNVTVKTEKDLEQNEENGIDN